MNSLFKKTSIFYRYKYYMFIDRFISRKGAQNHLYKDLLAHEKKKRNVYKAQFYDYRATDVLERALVRALGNYNSKEISFAEYTRIRDKVNDLKKVRFAENYDGFKIETNVGGTRERELFKLYDQVVRNERGEVAHKLWREKIEKDPQGKRFIGYF